MKNELNSMVDYIKPHIIGITESWAHNDITYAELGLEGHVMFRKDRIGKKGGGVLLYIKDTIGLYRDVWIAAIASSRKRLATLTGQCVKRHNANYVRYA